MRLLVPFRAVLIGMLLVASCQNIYTQTFIPEIENFPVEKYEADNQNWSIDADENGIVFIANNKGLLRYNGQSWQLFELPRKTIVRSVLCSDGKIYVGSYEEFGYWESDDFGEYTYTSLVSLFDKNHEFTSEEFWQIIKFKDSIVFRSFGGIYIYNGEKISYVNNSQDISDLVVYKNKLIVGSYNNSLRELRDEKLRPYLVFDDQIHFTAISNLVVFNNQLFLFDLNQGGYIYDSKIIYPLPENINSLLKNHVLNKVVFKDRDTMVFGTIKKGLIVYSLKDKSIQEINKRLGLQNNTVLGLKFHNGDLWGTLDNGISKINFESPYRYYYDLSGTLGAVYDVSYFDNQYYLASNTGIYRFTNDNKLQLVKNSEGHVWSLSIINNRLFCGHNNGNYYIENNELNEIELPSRGVYNYIKVPSVDNTYLQGNYLGISVLTYKQSNWEINPIDGIAFPIDKIVFESNYIVWAAHPYKGVYRIQLDKNFTKALNVSYYGDSKSFKQYKTDIFKIDDEIVFYNSNEWFQFFEDSNSIGLFKKFNNLQNKILISKEANGAWFLDRKNRATLLYLNTSYEEDFKIKVPSIKQHLVAKYEKIIIKNDSIRIINLNDGFAIFNLNNIETKESKTYSPIIVDKIYSTNKKFSIKDTVFNIPFVEAKNISFEAYSPNMCQNDIVYILSGRLVQKGMLKNGKLSLQNLPFGDYSLSFKSEGFDNETSDKINISFSVLPPWYLSNLMIIVYMIIAIIIIYVIFKSSKIKIRKQQLVIKKEYIRDTQKRINKLEKENLERDIQNKKKQLTNTTETIIKKNETIILLRNELNRLLEVSPNKTRTKNLINLSVNKKGADYDWKIFESNFNELHEHFFKRLIVQYPKLTTKDLKLCAYIKSSLTSKEMAPLLGISTRGVEIHRYRLRKKIKLDSKDNISNFLKLF